MHQKWCIVQLNIFDGGVEDGSTNETGQSRTRTAGILERRTTSSETFGGRMEERREKYRADTRVSKEFLIISVERCTKNGVLFNR